MTYLDLDQSSEHNTLLKLASTPINLKQLLCDEREKAYQIQHEGIRFCYDKALVDDQTLETFQKWVKDLRILEQYQSLLGGEPLNISEKRQVTHHQTRKNIQPLLEKIEATQKVLLTKDIKTLVVIGIGGSELGSRAIYEALKDTYPVLFEVVYISNIDPVKTMTTLSNLEPKETCFILTSKSGTTVEMQLNWELVMSWYQETFDRDALDLKERTIAITTPTSPLIRESFLEIFTFEESVGGRFATTSTCGMVLVGLVFGKEIVKSFLEGAEQMDETCLRPLCEENAVLMAACIGVWHRTYLGMPNLGIIAYASSLQFFVKHLQQVDCESNGKSVNRYQEPVSYPTGPMVVYGVGTNAQHAFFQSLHQGTDTMPVELIGVQEVRVNQSTVSKERINEMQAQLNINLNAQALALAKGRDAQDPNKEFPGNRPSMTIWLSSLTPFNLGALLSFYENKVMFQGFLWNLNSFDQEGVQLGKDLAKTSSVSRRLTEQKR